MSSRNPIWPLLLLLCACSAGQEAPATGDAPADTAGAAADTAAASQDTVAAEDGVVADVPVADASVADAAIADAEATDAAVADALVADVAVADASVAADADTTPSTDTKPIDSGGPDSGPPAGDAAVTPSDTAQAALDAPQPDAALPDTSEADAIQVDTSQADTVVPDSTQPDTSQADTALTDTAQLDTSKPDTSQPDTSQPDTSQPDTSQPDTSQPDTAQADTGAPPCVCPTKDACTVSACVSGKCTHKPKSCDDGNVCTLDSCDKTKGCTHKPSAASCDDGASCVPKGCVGGVCKSLSPDHSKCGKAPSPCAKMWCDPSAHKADAKGCVAITTTPQGNYAPQAPSGGGKVVFRFRTWSGSRPSWVSDGSTNLAMSYGKDVKRYNRGPALGGTTPFAPMYYTHLDGTHHYAGKAAIPALSNVTIDAWFRTSKTTGVQTLISNTGHGGVGLALASGKLRGTFRVEKPGPGGTALTHLGSANLADGKWHHATFVARKKSGGFELCLMHDGLAPSCVFKKTSQPAKATSLPPVVGAEPGGSASKLPLTDRFTGDLYAAQIRSFAIDTTTLRGGQARDGSRYFGRPSYWDSLGSTPDVEQRIHATATSSSMKFTKPIRARLRVPYLNDHYVPQGMGASSNGDELFVTYYFNAKHQSADCKQGNPAKLPSILVGIDPCSGALTRTYLLYGSSASKPNTGHVGGVAIVPAPGGKSVAYIPSDGGLGAYAIDDPGAWKALPVKDPPPKEIGGGGAPRQILRKSLYKWGSSVSCGTSFVSYDPTSKRIWFGKFSTGTGAAICAAKVVGGVPQKVSATYKLPVSTVQGVLGLANGQLALSTSYGNNKSRIYRLKPGGSATSMLTGPPGFEDLARTPDGLVWTMSESGATYFQKRGSNGKCSSPWTGLYPYIFAFKASDVGG